MMRLVSIWVFVVFGFSASAQNSDLLAGYYYPEITSQESFSRVLDIEFDATAKLRVDFITTLTRSSFESPANPNYVVFVKGSEAQKLIIVALDSEVFKTLFRARAVLAQLTSNLRGGLFRDDERLRVAGTFYDLLQMMEFDTLVISDGESWSHRVEFARE